MPRPNPETILSTYPWGYTHYQSGAQSGTDPLTSFYRTHVYGEPSPGYPRTKLYHTQWVTKKIVSQRNSFRSHRRNKSSPSAFDIISAGANADKYYNTPLGVPYNQNSVLHDAVAIRIALNRAMDEVVDSKVNLAQAFAERAQTSRLVAQTATRLANCLTALRKGRFSNAMKHLGLEPSPRKFSQSLAENWLSLQYGWKPLLMDVKNSAELLAQTHMGKPYDLIVRRNYTVESPSLDVIKRIIDGGGGQIADVQWSFSKRVTTAKVKLHFRVTNEFIRGGKQLGITDPFLLAWELLPYSFVVDWFLPIGDFLERTNYDSGLTYLGGCTVEHTVQQVSLKAVAGNYNLVVGGLNYDGNVENYSDGLTTLVKFDRNALSSPPRPVLPSFKDPISTTHVLNALALLRVASQPKHFLR